MNPQSASGNLQGGGGGGLQGGSGQSVQQTVATPQVQNAGSIGSLTQQNQNTINSTQSFLNSQQNTSNQTAGLLQQIAALDNQIANKPLAPTLNYGAIQSAAQAQATKNVNPLYTQKLNEYLQNEAATTAQQQQQQQLGVQSAQAALQNTLGQNAIQQQATGQKTALDIGNINQQESNFETNTGMSSDAQRAQLNDQLGQSGLTASGYGQQQVWNARNQVNIQKTQQLNTDQYNRNSSLLNEQTTFDQLAQSGKYATTQEGEAESKSNLDLNTYLQQAAYGQQQFKEQNELGRQTAVLSQASQLASQKVAQFVNSFKSNPGLYNAALNAYGGLMKS